MSGEVNDWTRREQRAAVDLEVIPVVPVVEAARVGSEGCSRGTCGCALLFPSSSPRDVLIFNRGTKVGPMSADDAFGKKARGAKRPRDL
jgi:hypothetical protein